MPLHEVEIDELGLWVPRSGFFQHEYRKKRAKLMVQSDPAAQHAKLAFCTYHNTPYLSGDDIPNSPCCNTEPLLTYDLEEMQAAAGVISALLDALEAASPEELVALIQGLAELARGKVAGVTGELSEAPSTASPPATADDVGGAGPVGLEAAIDGSPQTQDGTPQLGNFVPAPQLPSSAFPPQADRPNGGRKKAGAAAVAS